MSYKTIALSCVILFVTTGCAHRVVYTESCEPEPVVVHRTVVVNRRPHYYHAPPRRVVVVNPRPYHRHDRGHREWARREERSAERRASVRSSGGVRFHAEASAR
jgi:hypothetical protein